ncbi:MAG: hypothetical protein AAGA30_19495, partial [Planctomycetota bacterium]
MSRRILFFIDSLFDLDRVVTWLPILESLRNKPVEEVHLASLEHQRPPLIFDELEHFQFHSLDQSKISLKNQQSFNRLVSQIRPTTIHSLGSRSHNLVTFSHKVTRGIQRIMSFDDFESINRATLFLLRNFSGRESLTLTVSHSLLQEFIARQFPYHPVKLIPNVAPSLTSDRASARDQLLSEINLRAPAQPPILVGCASNLAPAYRIKDLIWAMDLICCIRQDVHLVIFALGDKTAAEHFVSLTEAGSNIHFVRANQSSPSSLAGLDIFWNTQTKRPCPASMLAVMQLGVPVISVFGPETEDVLLPMRTGLS